VDRRGRHKVRRHGGGLIWLARGTVLAGLLLAATAFGQTDEGGPIVLGQRRAELETLHLERPSLALELQGLYSHDNNRSDSGTSDFQETFLSEIMDIATHGYFLSPNVASFNLALGVGLTQAFDNSSFNGQHSSDTAQSYLYNWDASATLFGTTGTPGQIYTRREQQWIDRQFGPTIQSTTTDSGASMDFKNGPVPTHLGYSHLVNTQDDVTGMRQLQFTSDVFSWFSTYRPTPNQSLEWIYTFSSVNEETYRTTSYQMHDATLRHTYRFGERNASSLISTLHYTDESGSFNNQVFHWSEYLTLQHSHDLETHYRYDFDQYSFTQETTTVNRGLAGFRHHLYKSLLTTGNIGVNDSSTSSGSDTREYFANIEFDYNKKVPLGWLTATLGYNWDRNQNSGGGQGAPVLNQAKTFNALDQIELTGFQIAPPLVVTDANHVLLTPGIDYTVDRSRPNHTVINRVQTGNIKPGDTVLLSYHIAPIAPNTTDTNVTFGTIRYDIEEGIFKGVGVYTRLTVSDQDIDTASPTLFVPNDYTDTAFGADYHIWDFTLNYEHEIHDSTINPFTADRAGISWNHRIDLNTSASAATTFNSIAYTMPVDHVKVYTVSGQINHNFSNELNGLLTGLYRNENQDIGGKIEGFETQVELNWHHRQTSVYARFRYSFYDTSHNKQDFQFFQLGVRREF